MSNTRSPRTVIGLGTFSFTAVQTGAHNVKGKMTLPEINQGASANSQVIVTINVNGGATIFTGPAGARSFESGSYLTAGDVLNVILSSSAPVDNELNAVKSTISFY